jgi:hypothetical protein
VLSPIYNRVVTLSKPASDFQIRSFESGTQPEGIVWNTGAIWLR